MCMCTSAARGVLCKSLHVYVIRVCVCVRMYNVCRGLFGNVYVCVWCACCEYESVWRL